MMRPLPLIALVLSLWFVTALQLFAKEPVKIFLLSGQSNMTGRGTLGDLNKLAAEQAASLVKFIKDPKNQGKYDYLFNGPNKTETGWTLRDDVFIINGEKHGGLGPYYGGRGDRGFGPELAIGHLLGNYFEEAVVLVKVSFGGNNLGANFRPPSSGGETGDKYKLVIEAMDNAIKRLPEIVPGYESSQSYELAGFFWNQGLGDMRPDFSKEYQANLANLIRDLRKDLKTPELKTVVAVTGNWGRDMQNLRTKLAEANQKRPGSMTAERIDEIVGTLQQVQEAQLAVPLIDEFKKTVASAETRDFWFPRETYGAHGTEEHWCANGESYWLIGESMGEAMIRLLESEKK